MASCPVRSASKTTDGSWISVLVDDDDRDAPVNEDGERVRGVRGGDQNHCVDLLGHRHVRVLCVMVRTVLGIADHQQVRLVAEHISDPHRHLGVDGVRQRRRDEPDGVGALTSKAAGDVVWSIVELAHRFQNPVQCCLRHRSRAVVEHVGDGGRRHGGTPRHVVPGGAAATRG